MATSGSPASRLRIAFAGATGAVGQHLAQRLRSHPDQVAVWAWQRAGAEPPDGNWNTLAFADGALQVPVDAFVSALGTTLKQAGSKAAFRAIDVDAVLARAAEARAQGARTAVVVSAVGASKSAASFYLRCKAEMEAGILALEFEHVHVMRPSLLLTPRHPSRPAEAVGQAVAPLMAPVLRGRFAYYRPVSAVAVAAEMWACLQRRTPERLVHHFDGEGWKAAPQ